MGQIIGRMQKVEKGMRIMGAPKEVYVKSNEDSFYAKARYGTTPVQGGPGSGVPGGKKSGGWFDKRKEHGDVADKGDKLTKHGHEYR